MNKTYRSVYNASTGTWVAAPETAKGRLKLARRTIVVAVLAMAAQGAMQGAYAFQPIGDNATGASSDLVIGDNAAGISYPTYFYPTMTTDPWGSPLPRAGSTIVGNNANANEHAGLTLFGSNTSASGDGAVALGVDSSAALDGTAVGTAAFATGNYSVALGRGAVASHNAAVAVGVLSTAAGDQALALGDYAFASGTSSIAAGDGAKSANTEAIAVGKAAQALGVQSISIGAGNLVNGDHSGAIGDPNTINGSGSYALGNNNTIDADNAFVVGNNVSVPAGLSGAVVLGNNATVSAATPTPGMTVNGVAYTFAGGSLAAGDVVSVGSAAAPRQIQNVAAGQVSATSTDAINGSQLHAVSQELDKPLSFSGNSGGSVDRHLGDTLAITGAATTAGTYSGGNLKTVTDPISGAINLQLADAPKFGNVTVNDGGSGKITGLTAGTAANDAVNVSQLQAATANAVLYDDSSRNSVTLGGDTYNPVTRTGGTKIVNVARGVDDSDAVNMSQLNETNAIINNFAGDQSDTYIDDNGRGIRYVRTNDSGLPLDDAHAQGVGSSALGYNAVALGGDALALGRNAVAANDNDVALGAGSVTQAAVGTAGTTIAGKDYTFAGTAPASTVSVGDIGAERTITNVAAGRIGATSTDAINGSQLYATNEAIEALDQGAVKYDRFADGTVNYNSVTMGGETYDTVTKTGGTRITNVARGVADSDAVNVSQLNEVKADVTSITNTVDNFAGDQSTTYTEENGHGIRYVRTNDTGLPQADAYAKGQASTAVGYNAQASGDSAVAMGRDSNAAGADAVAIGHNSVAANAGDVALGSGSVTAAAVATTDVTIAGKDYTFAGTAPTSTVSVGAAGAERTITNVAAGRISADSTDAVNGSQLYATNQAIEQIASNISTLDQGAVKYDTNADGTVNYNSVTMGGDTYNSVTKAGGTKITNVARGVNDSDAVNMSQLNETNAVINNFAGDQSTEYTEQNGRGIRYVRTNDTGLPQADAYAQGQGSTAVGYNATATGDSALALGRNAVASDANSVALGAGSVTAAAVATASGVVGGTTYQFAGGSAAGTVSVGSAGSERTVTNVAAGRISAGSTDAVNGSQLYATNQKVDENTQDIANLNQQVGGNTQSINSLNNRIDGVQRDANAGAASAMALAGLPQSVLPGKGMVALAGSTYSGQSALALGVSALSDSGKWVFKGGVTTNSRGNVGATIGAGFHW
ncbi:YadA-like family protein [Cupriavidus sp. WKF15]|uniref:YadA-like family protein n=1 Tax=Cupriavidus sp. WKF15 TaxID=3032282 RepID=UPI0023E3266F|nr:YadA-like family protein [Cupriavidus sp. WKF15]WER49886.1 YadA-like family protein [Cupriavidus sp. WKF15]